MLKALSLLLVAVMFRGDAAHSGVESGSGPRGTLQVEWTFHTDGPVRSSPAVTENSVYIGSEDGSLYAVARQNGRLLWKYRTGGPVNSSPAVWKDLVFVTSADGFLSALDQTTGHLRWRVGTGGDTVPRWGYEYIASSPTVADGIVYAGGAGGRLRAVQAATGAVLWTSDDLGGKIIPSPAVDGGSVYIGSDSGKVYALDRRNGSIRWTFETDGVHIDSEQAGFDRRAITASPAVAGDIVVVGARDGMFYGIDAANGKERWRIDNHVWVIASAVVSQGHAYVGTSDGKDFQAIELATGRQLWRTPVSDRIFSSAAMADGVLYFGDHSGAVHGLAAADGREAARFWIGAPITSSPSIDKGALYIGADDGNLYALTGKASAPIAHRAVFWQDDRPLRFRESARLRDAARAAGYEVVDGAKLAAFLEARLQDHEPGVVIFANDRIPKEIGADPGPDTLLGRYLSAGGRAVWLGIAPYAVVFDPQSGRPTGLDFGRATSFLGVRFETMATDDIAARATEAGRRRNLPSWWIASGGVEPKGMNEILATDDYGRAVTWIKRFGSGDFLMVSGGETMGLDPAALIRLAESATTNRESTQPPH